MTPANRPGARPGAPAPILILIVMAGLAGLAALPACASAASRTFPTVKAGSMARFVTHESHLYTLAGRLLTVYELLPLAPLKELARVPIPGDAETLFPYGDLLFVGSRQGTFVYRVAVPSRPELIGTAIHVVSCDPVVVANDVAYVTLRAGRACRGGVNALLVLDVSRPDEPAELSRQALPSPHGLGVDGDLLFVADARDGLLVFDVRDPRTPRLIGRAPDVAGYDVIADAGVLVVSAEDGLYQYQYGPEGLASTQPLSRIPVGADPPRAPAP